MDSSMMRAATDTMMMITTGFCSLEASATAKDRNVGHMENSHISCRSGKTWLFGYYGSIQIAPQ